MGRVRRKKSQGASTWYDTYKFTFKANGLHQARCERKHQARNLTIMDYGLIWTILNWIHVPSACRTLCSLRPFRARSQQAAAQCPPSSSDTIDSPTPRRLTLAYYMYTNYAPGAAALRLTPATHEPPNPVSPLLPPASNIHRQTFAPRRLERRYIATKSDFIPSCLPNTTATITEARGAKNNKLKRVFPFLNTSARVPLSRTKPTPPFPPSPLPAASPERTPAGRPKKSGSSLCEVSNLYNGYDGPGRKR